MYIRDSEPILIDRREWAMIEIHGRYYPDEYKKYAGCKNCEHQPEPLRMCEWGKRRNTVEPICSGWELKGVDDGE